MTNSHHHLRTRGPGVAPGAFQEDLSWQRNDLAPGGRHAGRQYYSDSRRSQPATRPVQPAQPVRSARPVRSALPWDAARALRVGGLVLVSAGAAAWIWLILAFVSSIGAGIIPDHPFSARVSGIPLSSGGLVAIVAGTLLATVGTWLAKAAAERRERTTPRSGRSYWP